MKPLHLISVLTASASIALVARALEIKLPPETARLAESPLPGYPLAVAQCATCHSVDYVKMQPTSSRTYWKANVTKMQKTFGAPIPDAMVDPIVDYLVKTYGNERPNTAPVDKSAKK
jgi:sulfite dehydrogenase